MNSETVIYQTGDGMIKIEATFNNDTVWLSIDQWQNYFNVIEV